jgi:hypothetical protein
MISSVSPISTAGEFVVDFALEAAFVVVPHLGEFITATAVLRVDDASAQFAPMLVLNPFSFQSA